MSPLSASNHIETGSTDPKRLVEIDLIVGFAIALVVLGHFADRSSQGIDWYVWLKTWIYKFHMPLFMFTSGVVAYHAGKIPGTIADYFRYIRRKLWRLGAPFLLVGLTLVFAKWAIQALLAAEVALSLLADELLRLFIYTSESAAGFLWYLVVLFELLIVAPLALKISGDRPVLVAMIAVILNLSRITFDYSNFLMFDFFIQFSLFFSIGQIYCRHREAALSTIGRYPLCWVVFMSMFILSFSIVPHIEDDFSKVIIGTLSIPAFLSFFLFFQNGKLKKFLCFLSEFSMTIYLFNSITIGILRGAMIYLVGFSSGAFLIMTPIFFVSGILVPILSYKYVFQKVGLGRVLK